LRSIPALLSGLSDEIARPVALAELPGLGDEVEPILVSERVDGRNLFEWLREERPAGMELQEAMPLIAEILSVVRKLHAGDLLVCDLDPRHFVVERGSEKLRYVATGNITRISKPPLGLTSGVYRAPEIRHEQSGRFLRPCADVFSLGLLIVFLMTAEEPALDPRSPLSRRAYDRLKNLPAGPRVWLAKMIQPMGKSRFSNLDKLQRHGPGNWPKPTDRGFGFLELPPPAGPALTPGPLVSR
jgi:serine/threonine protein kinase